VFIATSVVVVLAAWFTAPIAGKFGRRREILKANRAFLGELLDRRDWPSGLTESARQAAAIGRLIEAHDWAAITALTDVQSSSSSRDATNPARVPFSFSELPDAQATYYARLEEALLKVLTVPGERNSE
jgi:hypothetical protein